MLTQAFIFPRDNKPLEEGRYTCPESDSFYWAKSDIDCPYCRVPMSECHATNFAIIRRPMKLGQAVIDMLPADSRVFGCSD